MNKVLAAKIASADMFLDPNVTASLMVLLNYCQDEFVLEVARCTHSVLSGRLTRLHPGDEIDMDNFIANHRKILGLFLDSLDDQD